MKCIPLPSRPLLSGLSTSDQLFANAPSQLRSIDSDAPSEDQIEALFTPSSLRTLADVSSSHLERILSALASYSPLVDKSIQHRRHPMRWESVLNIVGAAGLVDGKYVPSRPLICSGGLR
jgi:hypothetical protein